MAPIYELWDFKTRNLVDAYDSEEAALDDVLYTLQEDGMQSVEGLALLRDDRGTEAKTVIALGIALADYAQTARERVREHFARN